MAPPDVVEAVVSAAGEGAAPGEANPGPAPAHGEPPAWAELRPELCDAIPWFRSSQGGCYYAKGYCWGLLVDADCGARSYLDDEVLITRMQVFLLQETISYQLSTNYKNTVEAGVKRTSRGILS